MTPTIKVIYQVAVTANTPNATQLSGKSSYPSVPCNPLLLMKAVGKCYGGRATYGI
jgi:hypothetical protein